MQPTNCPNCSEKTERGAIFCGNCGQSLVVIGSGVLPSSTSPVIERTIPAYAKLDPMSEKRATRAFTALMLAIMALPALLIPYVSVILAIVAIGMSRQVRPTLQSKGISTATYIIAGIAIGLAVAIVVLSVIFFDPASMP